MPSSGGEGHGRRVFLPVALAAFITSLDATVVTVAAPSIKRDLGLSLSDLEWVATSYVLAFASLLLVGGRLTDLLGRRRVLQWGLWGFAAASVLMALAPGAGVLLGGRLLQGSAAAMMLPAALAVLSADVSGKDRHLGAGIFTAAIAAALALGPFVGGAVSQYLHWSYIFWLNLPVVMLASASVRWAVPAAGLVADVRVTSRKDLISRLDPLGLALCCLALSGVTFALVEGQKLGLGSPWVLGSLVLAVLGACAAMVVERRTRYPLLDLELIRHPVVAGGTGVQILWGLGINGVFFFTSLFLQDVLMLSPTTAGLTFVPLAVSVIVTVPLAARLAASWGPHWTVAAGMTLVSGGLFAVTQVGPGDGAPDLIPALILVGVGSALTTPLTSAVLEVVPPGRAGVVSAIVSVAREVSGVLGIAVTGAILTVREASQLRAGAAASEAFLTGYRTGLMFGAVAALLGAVIAAATLRPRQPMLANDLDLDLGADIDPGDAVTPVPLSTST